MVQMRRIALLTVKHRGFPYLEPNTSNVQPDKIFAIYNAVLKGL